jgi:hypothetical protein
MTGVVGGELGRKLGELGSVHRVTSTSPWIVGKLCDLQFPHLRSKRTNTLKDGFLPAQTSCGSNSLLNNISLAERLTLLLWFS